MPIDPTQGNADRIIAAGNLTKPLAAPDDQSEFGPQTDPSAIDRAAVADTPTAMALPDVAPDPTPVSDPAATNTPSPDGPTGTVKVASPGKSATRMAFEKEFAQNRKAGNKTFSFRGKLYNTKLAMAGGGEVPSQMRRGWGKARQP